MSSSYEGSLPNRYSSGISSAKKNAIENITLSLLFALMLACTFFVVTGGGSSQEYTQSVAATFGYDNSQWVDIARVSVPYMFLLGVSICLVVGAINLAKIMPSAYKFLIITVTTIVIAFILGYSMLSIMGHIHYYEMLQNDLPTVTNM